MRILRSILLTAACTPALASWFGSDNPPPPYKAWSTTELSQWLYERGVPVPSPPPSYQEQLISLVADNWNSGSSWTQEQYNSARQAFQNMRESSFEAWDESRLREFLLERGIVSPHSTKEHLALIAKSKYKEYQRMSQQFEDRAREAPHKAAEAIAQATAPIDRKIDDSRDYVYSVWDNNRLRTYLEDQGYLQTKNHVSRHDLLGMMKHAYASIVDPVWEAWSTSYIHEWLVGHGLIRSDYEKNRDELIKMMKSYYYDVNDRVWNTWSDNDLRSWLVDHGIIKRNAQVNRQKMLKLISDNYLHVKDTFWTAWSDSQLRDWLVQNGHVRSDAQMERDELIKLVNDKYTDAASKTSDYLLWPDARLRAFLRERGAGEDKLRLPRPELLQEVRVRYVQTQPKVMGAFHYMFDVASQSVTAVGRYFGILSTRASDLYDTTAHTAEDAKHYGQEKVQEGKQQASEHAERAYEQGAERARQFAKQQGQRGQQAAREKTSASEL